MCYETAAALWVRFQTSLKNYKWKHTSKGMANTLQNTKSTDAAFSALINIKYIEKSAYHQEKKFQICLLGQSGFPKP
jgi:hypothetical protein